jgi:hypothetical protein
VVAPEASFGVDRDDLPVAGLGGDERSQFRLLGFEAEGLVVFVGGAADVDPDPAGRGSVDLLDPTRTADLLRHCG